MILYQDKLSKQNAGRQENTESNGTPIPGGAIQVVLKGQREVLTLRKFPSNAEVTTYKPNSKTKQEEVPTSDKTATSEVKTKTVTDRTDKGVGTAVSKQETANQSSSSNNAVSVYFLLSQYSH